MVGKDLVKIGGSMNVDVIPILNDLKTVEVGGEPLFSLGGNLQTQCSNQTAKHILIVASKEEIIRLATANKFVSLMGADVEARLVLQWFETKFRQVPFDLVAPFCPARGWPWNAFRICITMPTRIRSWNLSHHQSTICWSTAMN
jgi:hypothetical protein